MTRDGAIIKVPLTMTMKATTATLVALLRLWCLASPCVSFGITSSLKFCQNRVSSDLTRGRRSCDLVRLYDASSASATTFEALEEDLDETIGAWIPIASASALKGLGPQRVQVMGLELAVWQANATGPWSVMSDACPHRLAPLSQGRVDPETNCIECPYHGWQFDTNGTLKDVPQLEANRTVDFIKGGDATSLPVHLAGDMIFAFLPSSVHGEMFPQSLLPEDMYPTLREEMSRNATYYTRDLPYSTDLTIENFMDPAHIPFAHHSLQSVRSDARDIPMRLYVSNFTHVEVFFEDESRGKMREYVWQCALCVSRVMLFIPSSLSFAVVLYLGSDRQYITFVLNATTEPMPLISTFTLSLSKLADLVSCSPRVSFLGSQHG